MSRWPHSLRALSWELPRNFLGLEEALSDFEAAGAVILPVPYEATVSYGAGTGNGPAAILEASRYIELYDNELDGEPCRVGIATLPELHLTGEGPEAAVRELGQAYQALLDSGPGKFVITLGGEHSISSAPILAWAERLRAQGRRLTVLQFDAHTDLRQDYEGSPYSHASVMYRAQAEGELDIVAVGIRAMDRAEVELVRGSEHLHVFPAHAIHGSATWMDDVVERLGPDVYISFDVDAFDPSLVPATGTPEPGGLSWYPVLELLRRVFSQRTVHAADVVELAPIPGYHAPDFLVAKLVYKMIGYRFESS